MSDDEPKYSFTPNVRFIIGKAYDRKGNEIKNPICMVCKNYKNQVIGKDACTWICMNGCEDEVD